MPGPDYIVDVKALSSHHAGVAAASPMAVGSCTLRGRPWLAVHWKCCRVYSRVYRNRHATAYDGRCPACGRPLHVRIGPDGTSSRFFEAI